MEGGSIAAVMEDIQTRTAVTDEGTFTWSAGDKVWLQITTGGILGTLSSGEGTSSASFSYGAFFGDMTGKAIYPYNEGHSVSEDELNIVLPASYDLGSNLSNTNAAMYGESVNGIIRFNHLAGIMRFVFKNAPVGANRFEIRLDKKINGTFAVDLAADSPTLQTESTEVASEKMVTFNFETLTEVSDIKLYVPLPVGTYTTLDLRLYADQEELWTYSNEVTNTIGRKTLKLMPAVSMGGSVGGDIESGEDEDEANDYIDEYGINQGPGVEIDGVIWAPVNCGYEEADSQNDGSPYGKLYQWGRKYGQGYNYTEANFPSFVCGPVFTSEAEAEENADKFFYVSGNTNSFFYDWEFPSLRDITLWNSGSEEDPIKTIYDPCPNGWRVPTEAEVKSLFKNKSPMETLGSVKGARFTGNTPYDQDAQYVFIPAAGRRNEYATPQLRKERVICWSSKYARYVYYTGNTSSENLVTGCSAYGQSVRCVKETERDLHSLVVSQKSLSIPSGSNSTKFYIESSDVAWSISSDNEDFIVVPTTGVGRTEVEVICHSSSKTQCNIYVTTHALRLSTDRQYVVTISRERNNSICYIDDQGYNHGEGIELSGVIWAPVNCGCEGMSPTTQRQGKGLYYQWGRKYGQGAADGTDGPIAQVVQGPVSIATANSEANANVFYKSSSNDWATSSDNTLWNSGSQDNPVKTEYDPCPDGWRVPTSLEIASLYESYQKSSKNGNLGVLCYGSEECDVSNPSVFLPSSDILSSSTGNLLLGTDLDVWRGSYWTSTRYSSGAYSVSFGSYGSGSPHISTIANVAWGYKVRCVSENSSLEQ